MRRFLSLSFLALALMIGATGAAPVAHATALDTIGSSTDPFANAAATAAAQKAAEQTPTAINPNVDNSILAGIMVWLQSLFAWLLGVAAITLDNAVYYTVVSMGTYVSNLTAIGVTWRILRDIGNIMLIFGFLAIGISVILNTERIGYGKKMLPMLLVAAVFLNFSLFFSEAIIDTGNLFATQFYTQINGGNPAGAKNFDLTSVSNEGISNKIMAQLGLARIYSAALTNNSVYKGTNVSAISFMSIILFIVAAFVMFSLAFILIARFVMLIFLIILAPVGFAGLAVPQLKGQADKWWGKLFEQTITAPILLLLLYVALAVITDAHFLGFGPSADWAGFVPQDNGSTNFTGFASMMLSFLVAMGLLLLVTISAKSLSAFGASKATGFAGKLTFGATALAGRSTVGWGANRLAKYARSTRLARIPLVGTGIVKGLDKVATGSFDVRGATSVAGLKEAGAPQKGGYRAELKARTESRTKYAKDLTGRELTDEEKVKKVMHETDQKEEEKLLNEKRIQQARNKEQGRVDQALDTEIVNLNESVKQRTKKIEDLESETDKGAQRKYASNLELGYLKKVGVNDEAIKFLNIINPAANTEAAKTIRKEAKKSADDKTLDELKKALKKAGGEEETPAPAVPAAGGAAPAAGGR